ncbi:unnamed protein product [Chrysoparadoxa australica]
MARMKELLLVLLCLHSAHSFPISPSLRPPPALPSTSLRALEQGFDEDFEWDQRVESGKSAILTGAAGLACRLVGFGVGALPMPEQLRLSAGLPAPGLDSFLFACGCGALQGALFGLTYRYVIRTDLGSSQDDKDDEGNAVIKRAGGQLKVGHLGDGAFAAFTLVAAVGGAEVCLTEAAGQVGSFLLGETDVGSALMAALVAALPLVPRIIINAGVFGGSRAVLEWALESGKIKPFP